MKPILFPASATTFNTNGIGRLDAISCVVTEERNGIYELELTIAESTAHASEIEMSSIIVAKPSEGANAQAFRVYKISKPIDGKFSVLAQHISYQLSYIPVMPFEVTASSSACNQALQGLKSHAAEACPFTFWTDVTTVASFAVLKPLSLRATLGGVEGSVLDKFSGEYEWDNYTVKLHRVRGVQTPTVYLRYGKNITDLKQETYISNTLTGLCPYWVDSEGGNMVTLTEKVVESQYASNFPFNRTTVIDLSQDFKEQPTEDMLRNAARAYLNQSGVGIPTVSIKLSFINLADSEGYEELAAFQSVKLCDMVGVQFEKLGINTTAKVVKTEYDVLKEKYISIEIGSLRSSLASTIVGTNDAITALQSKVQANFQSFSTTMNNAIGDAVDDMQDALDEAVDALTGDITSAVDALTDDINNATAWLTGGNGYVVATKNQDGSWKELLFLDTPDIENAVNVLRINENGIGFSHTGVDGAYTQAWTLDGHLLIGGANAPELTVYAPGNPPTILFQANRYGVIWNAANSSMDVNGVISLTGAQIQSSATGARVIIDTSSSIKGMWGDTLHNLINMEQSVSGTHQMTIDADTQLNIRTPNLYVTNRSNGTGDLEVYQTVNGNVEYIYNVDKDHTGCTEGNVNVGGVDVYCTLPVFLDVQYRTYSHKLGMKLTGATARSRTV